MDSDPDSITINVTATGGCDGKPVDKAPRIGASEHGSTVQQVEDSDGRCKTPIVLPQKARDESGGPLSAGQGLGKDQEIQEQKEIGVEVDEESSSEVDEPTDSLLKFLGWKDEEITLEADEPADSPTKITIGDSPSTIGIVAWTDEQIGADSDLDEPAESPRRFLDLDSEYIDGPDLHPETSSTLPTEDRFFAPDGSYTSSRVSSASSREYVEVNWTSSAPESPVTLQSMLNDIEFEEDEDAETTLESEFLKLPNEVVYLSTQECSARFLRVPREFHIPESIRLDLQLDDDSREMEIEIPVISLHALVMEKSSYDEKLMVKRRISEACRKWGVFQVSDHGIPSSMVEKAIIMSKRFFDLPMADKMVYAMSDDDETGYGGWKSSETQSRLWGDQLVHVLHLDKSLLELNMPTKPSKYGEYMFRYAKLVKMLNMQLLGACAQVQNVDVPQLERTLADEYLKIIAKSYGTTLETMLSSMTIGAGSSSAAGVEAAAARIVNVAAVRVNYHPPCPQPELVLGMEPCRTRTAFEIVVHNETPGLQFLRAGRWRTVKYRKNALVVFVGKALQHASKDMAFQYKTVKHRVLADKDLTRVSVTTAFGIHAAKSGEM
ncbi:hypothetical protein R1flu_001188 [Riccia fluitans]|uniref:Uncharacterized protein n=1 Tax=Riccia fluitans TaxID=41844 RepID=A0ABD1Y2J4_9MARC